MADVFISYKTERRNAAQHLSRIFELNGYSVWFDYGLLSGTDFGPQIERELRAAKAVVVVWCGLSRDSRWVLEEAHLAERLGTLTPICIERVELPLGFGRTDTIDLSGWDGSPRSRALDRLLNEVARRVGREPEPSFRGLQDYEEMWHSFGSPPLIRFALVDPIAEEARGLGTMGVAEEPASASSVIDRLKLPLGRPTTAFAPPDARVKPKSASPRLTRRAAIAAGAAAIVAAAGGGGWFWIRKTRPTSTLAGHTDEVTSVAFSADGRVVAAGSADKTATLWDTVSGKLLNTLTGHGDAVTSIAISRDSSMLASASKDRTIKLWSMQSGTLLRTLTGHTDAVFAVAVALNQPLLASASADHTIKVWRSDTGELLQTLTGYGDAVLSVAFSPDAARVISGSADDTVRNSAWGKGGDSIILKDHTAAVDAVSWSTNWETFGSGSWDRTIKIWKTQNLIGGIPMRTLSGHSGTVASIAFSRDGQTIASGSWDKTVKLWDPETGRLLDTFGGHDGSVNSVTFSGDGKTLASGSADKTVRLWDVAALTLGSR